VCQQIHAEAVEVDIQKVEAAAMDEMWSLVGKKVQQRWLGHAIDQTRRVILADVCGPHEDEIFWPFKEYLRPVGITRFDTDHGGVYRRHLSPDHHDVGKQNTHRSERQHRP
jgi:insertion element IS1 protein InsB